MTLGTLNKIIASVQDILCMVMVNGMYGKKHKFLLLFGNLHSRKRSNGSYFSVSSRCDPDCRVVVVVHPSPSRMYGRSPATTTRVRKTVRCLGLCPKVTGPGLCVGLTSRGPVSPSTWTSVTRWTGCPSSPCRGLEDTGVHMKPVSSCELGLFLILLVT